ncbi:MAG: dTMP kinase [Kiritimatiellaceae bacterium TMED266]|nr:MAG: dTMP kinase [Kiritimatiellaceae bacterium TMED266]|tara:strand:- start:2751 stop:3380 length:630 start_codon:yes stop_codon:yes gene_type:complete
MNGHLITFEGPEGSGKSTQISSLVHRLREEKEPVISLREPGGTELGESIRDILQSVDKGPSSMESELLLFLSSRAQLVAEIISPALNDGMWVICDRFIDSSLAYQGYGRGMDLNWVRKLNAFATMGIVPCLTIMLQLNVDECFQRMKKRYETINGVHDRIEREPRSFHERVINGYKELSNEEARFEVFDATESRDVLADAIYKRVMQLK